MTREVTDGVPVIDQFPVFDTDGFSKKSGLLQSSGDFEPAVFRNGEHVTSITVTVEEIDTTGEYKVTWTPPPGNLGFYVVQVFNTFNKEHWQGEYDVSEATFFDDRRIRGLLHENAIVDKHVYDAIDQLISARLRVFATAVDVPSTPNGAETTGLLHEYAIEASYEGPNRLVRYALKRIL